MSTTSALTVYDHAMIVFCLAFMVFIGWAFRHFNKNSSNYFRGAGNMLWWMAGSLRGGFTWKVEAVHHPAPSEPASLSGWTVVSRVIDPCSPLVAGPYKKPSGGCQRA